MTNLFIDNKYYRIYFKIIVKAQGETRSKGDQVNYFERHHIIPKAFGGSNDADNLVLLTAREHFICHWLLTKCVNPRRRRAMMTALGALRMHGAQRRYTARQYEVIRKAKRDGQFGRELSAETRKKLGDAARGKPQPDISGRRSLAHKGRPKSHQHRAKLSESHRTSARAKENMVRLHTDQAIREKKRAKMLATARSPAGIAQREALAAFNREREYIKDRTCEHCGKVTTKAMHVKWHGDRCKFSTQLVLAAGIEPASDLL